MPVKDVSIIIPVWNAEDYLPRCLDSIVAQTWDHDRIEVILVDDGSTDRSGDICDDYARRDPMFHVIHQGNAGGPAAPRNRGIEIATGEYLFFCDNDDYFGPEAVERMVAHAHEWGSDVLLLKMGQSGGRDIPIQAFERELPKADLYASAVTSTLGPWKLYRRSLIMDRGIRFPEDCSFDDSVFTLHAMLHAETVSVANDYEYYFWVLRPDGGNVSVGEGDSAWRRMDRRLRGLERLFGLVGALADRERAELNLLPKIVREPVAATVRRLTKCEPDEADRWAGELRSLLRGFYMAGVADRIRFDLQLMFAVLMQTEESEGLRAMLKRLPALPDDLRFFESDGAVLYEHLTDARHPVLVRGELGPLSQRSVLTIRTAVVAAAWDHGSLALDGQATIRTGGPLALTGLELRIQHQRLKGRVHFVPVEILGSSMEGSAAGRIIATTIRWRSVVERALLEIIALDTSREPAVAAPHRWDLDLIIRTDCEVRNIRVGADREPGVFAGFAAGAMVSPTSVFVPDETGERNFSLWEITSGSELSGFRVKANRPAANVAVLSELACNDYVAARAVAERIAAGRFDRNARRARRRGRATIFAVRSFVMRVLRGMRRRLRRRK